MDPKTDTHQIQTLSITAINPKNQGLVNKACKWLVKHNNYNRLRDIADGSGDLKAYNKYDQKCQDSFNKFLEYLEDLPKGQQKAIEKSDLY